MDLKMIVKKIINIPKELFKRFPVSIIISIISSILIAVLLDNKALADIFVFLLIFGIGSLFTEVCFNKKKIIRVSGYIVSFILGVLFNHMIKVPNVFFIKLAIIYGVVLFILGLLKLFKDSNLDFSEYLIRVATNLFKIHIISSILSFGLLLISGILIVLFKVNELVIVRLEILLSGIYYLPALMYAFSDTKEKVWDFIKFIVKNILSVILFISFAIVYIYMLKILITWKVPSNYIFRVVSILFVLGLPIWTMIGSFKEDNILVKINKYIPYLFIPLFLLQIYSLSIRIIANGITIIRYIGICLLIIELIYLIIYLFQKKKVYLTFYAVIILIIIGLIIPKINAIDLTVNNQFKRINYYLNKKDLSKKEKNSLYQTYTYLIGMDAGEKLVKEKLSKEQIDFILEEKQLEYECYFSEAFDLDNVKISGYNKIKPFNSERYDTNEDISYFESININNHNVDLSDFVDEFIKSDNDIDFLKTNNAIEKDDYKIIVTDIQICFNNGTIESYFINGYVLEK